MMQKVRVLSLLCVLGGLGMLLAAWFRPLRVLVLDGDLLTGRSRQMRVEAALAEWGIGLRPEDLVWPPRQARLYRDALIVVRRASALQWYADGQSGRLWIQSARVGNALLQAGIRLFPGDEIWLDGAPGSAEAVLDDGKAHTLQVRRARPWVVHTPRGVVRISAPDLGMLAALWAARQPLFAGDAFFPSWDAAAEADSLRWLPSRLVTVRSAYGSLQGRVTAQSVGEALAQLGLSPHGLDYTVPALDAPLPPDGQIRLVRVREEIIVEQQPIPFDVAYQPLPDVEIGEIRVLQSGQFGVEARRVRVRREDGVEVARSLESSAVVQEPQNRVVGYGTLAVPHTVQTPQGTLTYWRAAQVYVTSYSPCRLGIPNYCNDITASGQRLRKGLVAVTRRQYAALAGSQVYVPGYGLGTVADIGAGVPGREWLDLGYSDEDFISWHQTVTVYYLWPPPKDLTWLIP